MGLNKPVDFTTAKLLKEKGFDKPVHQYYEFIRNLSSKQDKTWQLINSSFLVRGSDAAMFPDEGKNGVEVFAYSDRIYKDFNFKTSEDFISAPTIAEVVMWLYEKYGIWVEIRFADDYKIFFYDIINTKNLKAITSKSVSHFNSPTEAYENAIEYVLVNLT